MTHEDWLYLIEFHMKQDDPEAAERMVQAMKKAGEIDTKLTLHLEKAQQIINEYGHTAHYFKP